MDPLEPHKLTRGQSYHWGLLIASKDSSPQTTNMLIHAKETISPTTAGPSHWMLSAEEGPSMHHASILVRILVAKISDLERAKAILQSTPVRTRDAVSAPFTEHRGGYRMWNCISWVREGLSSLGSSDAALGTNVVAEWERIRDEALEYVEMKKGQHRFDGKAEPGRFDMDRVPTLDLVLSRETVE